MTETELVQTAQWDNNALFANRALAILREEYDSTYAYCPDCDDLLCTEAECCQNNLPDSDVINEDLIF